MVIEALQSYAQLASGLTKTTREQALATAKGLLDQAGLGEVAADAGDRVSKLADELLATSKANRQALTKFVDAEVTKAVGQTRTGHGGRSRGAQGRGRAPLRTATVAAATSAAPAPSANRTARDEFGRGARHRRSSARRRRLPPRRHPRRRRREWQRREDTPPSVRRRRHPPTRRSAKTTAKRPARRAPAKKASARSFAETERLVTEAPVPERPRRRPTRQTVPVRRPDLDELVGGLDDLADRPVGEHHDRLAEVHEALHCALHEPPPAP